jgi:hypothetical protein
MQARTLLLNWVCHAVEAFKTTKGLSIVTEHLEIHLLLNSKRRSSWRAHAIGLHAYIPLRNLHNVCLAALQARLWKGGQHLLRRYP